MKRPFVVSILAILLMITGPCFLVSDWLSFRADPALLDETLWIAGAHLLAVVAGAFLLRGQNWARWLAVAWITLQLILSLWHPPMQLLMNTILFAVFLWCLFRGKSGDYFAHREPIR